VGIDWADRLHLAIVKTAAIVFSAFGAAGALSGSVAAQPPPIMAHIALTHARPAAGTVFAGVTVTPGADGRIVSVACDATVEGKILHASHKRFYADGVDGPAAVSCSWKIPASARGRLAVRVGVTTSRGNILAPLNSWRIRRS
jgi:hypothetical protein